MAKVNYSTYRVSDKSFYILLKYKNVTGVTRRGVIFDPSGNIIYSYAQGLGKKMNNHVEWETLSQGLEATTLLHIDSFQVFGDSQVVIQKMQKVQSKKDKAKDRI